MRIGFSHSQEELEKDALFQHTFLEWFWARYWKKIRTKLSLVNILFYVDDGCFVTENFEDLETLIKVLEEEFAQIGLKLNKKKSDIIGSSPTLHQTRTKQATELATNGKAEELWWELKTFIADN